MEVGFRSLRTGRVGFKNILLSVWIRFSHFSSELGRVFQWLKKKKAQPQVYYFSRYLEKEIGQMLKNRLKLAAFF